MSEDGKPHKSKPVVIVSGSSGMLGAGAMEVLKHDYQVIGFDRDGQPQPPPEVECIVMEMTNEESVRLAFERVAYAYGKRIAAFVHLAAYVDFTEKDSPLYEQVTVRGTERLLGEMRAQGFECERFVFSSTMLVHAPTEPGRPITEDSPLEGKWGYPKSKIEAERAILEQAGDYPTAFLRIAGVYTEEGGAPTLAEQIRRIYERQLQSHLLPGDPETGQSFVHLDDALAAIRAAVDRRGDLPRNAVYLVGEPETYVYQDLQDAIGRALHGREEWETIRVPERLAEVGARLQNAASAVPGVDEPFIKPFMIEMADDHYELDISRARQELGWTPKHRLIDEVPRMCERLKRDPEAWYKANKMER